MMLLMKLYIYKEIQNETFETKKKQKRQKTLVIF